MYVEHLFIVFGKEKPEVKDKLRDSFKDIGLRFIVHVDNDEDEKMEQLNDVDDTANNKNRFHVEVVNVTL